MYKNNLRLI